jgi:hypothetical protein
MPLKLNVGLSKKVGEPNYGSRGASVNVEMELDGALVAEPGKLQDRIRQLFGVVRASLAEGLNGNNGHASPEGAPPPAKNGTPSNGYTNGNGAAKTNGVRKATQSQVKAIYAISKSHRIDLPAFLHERFHVYRADELSIKEASSAIDALKGQDSQEGG